MEPIYDTYPLFVANQVLKKDHLNELFNYLDEQNRLTRTNLIGIGIVCGVDIIPDPANSRITVTRCGGVTSLGYLVAVEQVVLTRYRVYQVPDPQGYDPLYDTVTKKNKYDLWEMLPSGGTNDLDDTFWRDKVVLIFVELKEENLKNCSPNSCDDRGSEVGVTYRYLLIRQSDADELKKARLNTTGNQTSADLEALQNARALLKEIRLKRFDVPRRVPPIVTTEDVFDAYRKLLDKPTIEALKAELIKAFGLYKPLLGGLSDAALQGFATTFTYTAGQLSLPNPLLYQYYYDFLSDLLEAYNELRLKGIAAISVCCPDANWFPRHLMLGKATEDTTQIRSAYRDYFIPSPLFSCQQGKVTEIRQLVERLLRMIESFEVPMPKSIADQNFVRITPSRLGNVRLSEKSIPFYYRITTGNPPLYERWNDEKTRQQKAKNNLTYHADQYPLPVENFVLKPLEYDWEPYNFFRIEGHVGLHWFYALQKIVGDRTQYRLPFEVVAVKTGRRFDNVFDLHLHACYFQDLEALFVTLKEELICLLCQEARYFYRITLREKPSDEKLTPKVDFLRHCQADFTYSPNTWGHLYDQHYVPGNPAATLQKLQALDGDATEKGFLFLIHSLVEAGQLLAAGESLSGFPFDTYQQRHQELLAQAASQLELLRTALVQNTERFKNLQWLVEDLIDHLDFILRTCKTEAIESLIITYRKRLETLQKQLLFGNYVHKNPGINHKAGVPVGGTFILVYTGEDEEIRPQKGTFRIRGKVLGPNREPVPGVNITVKDQNCGALADAEGNYQLTLAYLPATLLVALAGLPSKEVVVRHPDQDLDIVLGEEPDEGRIANNLVIADFYLPYLCCSDCAPMQVTLPEPRQLVARLGDPLCDPEGQNFTVEVTLWGGNPPYTVDGQAITGNSFSQAIPSGQEKTVQISDAAGQTIAVTIPAHTCQPTEEPCNLPCDGQAERCWYPLWLPKPSGDRRIQLTDMGEMKLVITDHETNKVHTVDFRELYREVLAELAESDFDDRMDAFVKKLNELIATEIGNPDTFLVLYDSENRLIGFEHYLCHTFTMDLFIAIIMMDKPYNMTAHYDEAKWMLEELLNQQRAEGKKFGCEQLDKCKNTSQKVCKREIKPESVQVKTEGGNNNINYASTSTAKLDTVLWIFENGQPLFSQQTDGTFETVARENNVWFLGTKGSCFITKTTVAMNVVIE